MSTKSKWSKSYWSDLAERVGATAIGALIAALSGAWAGAIPNDPAVWWVVIGAPTLFSLLKGLLANLADAESGPSLLPSPPAPPVPAAEPEPVEPAVQPVADAGGTPFVRPFESTHASVKKAPAKKAAKKTPPKPKG